jgi:hypothetical protein
METAVHRDAHTAKSALDLQRRLRKLMWGKSQVGNSRGLGQLRCACVILGAAALMLSSVCRAEKTDVVVLINGDRITGEVKTLQQGRLSFSTDHFGTAQIEWDKIAQLTSRRSYEIELRNGVRYFGVLEAIESVAPFTLAVRDEEGRVARVESPQIVRITPLESGHWRDRLDGYLSIGFSYAKASDVTQFNLDGGVTRRTRERLLELTAQSTASDNGVGQESASNKLTGVYQRLFTAHWFYAGVAQLTQDDEFDLDLRLLAGGGLGRFFIRTNQQEGSWLAGLAVAREYWHNAATEDSLEALLAAKYALFRYDEPETSLTASMLVLPSLSNWGRVRSETSLKLRHELVKDFFAELNLFHNYDSEPLAPNVPTGDWGAVTSLGYSF